MTIQDNSAKEQRNRLLYQLCSPPLLFSWLFLLSLYRTAQHLWLTLSSSQLKTYLFHFQWVGLQRRISERIWDSQQNRNLAVLLEEGSIHHYASSGQAREACWGLPPTSLHMTRADNPCYLLWRKQTGMLEDIAFLSNKANSLCKGPFPRT